MKRKICSFLATVLSLQIAAGAGPVYAVEKEQGDAVSAENQAESGINNEENADISDDQVQRSEEEDLSAEDADQTERNTNSSLDEENLQVSVNAEESEEKEIQIEDEKMNPGVVMAASGAFTKEVTLRYVAGEEILKTASFKFNEADENNDFALSAEELDSKYSWGIPDGYFFGGNGIVTDADDFNNTDTYDVKVYDSEPSDEELMNESFILKIYLNRSNTQSTDPFVWKDVDKNADGILSLSEINQSSIVWSGYRQMNLNNMPGFKFEDPEHMAVLRGGRIQKNDLFVDQESAAYNELINSTFTADRYSRMDGDLGTVDFIWKEADQDGDLLILSAAEQEQFLPAGYSFENPAYDRYLADFLIDSSREHNFSYSMVPTGRKDELMNDTYTFTLFYDEDEEHEPISDSFIWKDRDLNQDTYLAVSEIEDLLPEDYIFKYVYSENGVRYVGKLYNGYHQSVTIVSLNKQVEVSFNEGDQTVKTVTIVWKDYDLDRDGSITGKEIESLLPEGYEFVYAGTRLTIDGSNQQSLNIRQIPVVRPVDQFVDIPEDHWGREVINEAVEKGIMVGLDDEHFGPSEPMSRAMAVTVLWRLAGTPETACKNSFTDIQDDLWYTKAVNWAMENNVVHGMTETTFEPDTNINREQLAVMITNYLHSRGMSLETDQSLDQFKDKDEVSSFAETSMKFVVKHGIMSGAENGTMLMPKKDTERAEAAKMFLLASKLN